MRQLTSRQILSLSTALALLSALPAAAQTSVALTESVAHFTPDVQVLGEADAASSVHFQVALRLRNAATLAASNAARIHLSPSDLDRAYLPTRANHDAVIAWLRAQGLTIEHTDASRLTIEASGNAADVSRALGVHFSKIMSEGENFTAADSAPVIPATLAGVVLSINGLQPHLHAHKMSVVHPFSNTAVPYYAGAFVKAYGATSLGNGGANTTTAIVIDTFPKTTDLTKYWTTAGIAQSLSNITLIQAVSGTLPAISGEESMDAQIASSVAPASKVRVYASKSLSYANLDTAFQKVVTDLQAGVVITQVSISLGGCETSTSAGEIATDDNFFSVMSSLGATVFVSSGDSGSHECGGTANVPSFFATSPNVTAVGGTTLKLTTTGTTKTETSWTGSGGGISQKFAKPSYQSALSYAMRAVPDISTDANPNTGALVYVSGASQQIGGTSLSAPMCAGLAALVNSSRLAASKPTLGLLNSRIYPLLGSTNFRDIKTGSNGGYTASAGFDLVTGIGSPALATLLPTLVAQP